MAKIIVFYDPDCPLCERLAKSVTAKDNPVEYRAWTEGKARVLRVEVDGVMYEDKKAWEYLLTVEPKLAALSWIAQKLGLQAKVASTLRSAGNTLRKLCCHCR